MADDFLLMRRKRKDQFRQREEERRRKQLIDIDVSPSNDDNNNVSERKNIPEKVLTSTSHITNELENVVDNKHTEVAISKPYDENFKNEKVNCLVKDKKIGNTTNIQSTSPDDTFRMIPRVAGYAHTRASPASSVSFSQSSATKVGTNYSWKLNKQSPMLLPSTKEIKKAAPQSVKRLYNNSKDSDTSSGEEDLLQLAREQSRRREIREKSNFCKKLESTDQLLKEENDLNESCHNTRTSERSNVSKKLESTDQFLRDIKDVNGNCRTSEILERSSFSKKLESNDQLLKHDENLSDNNTISTNRKKKYVKEASLTPKAIKPLIIKAKRLVGRSSLLNDSSSSDEDEDILKNWKGRDQTKHVVQLEDDITVRAMSPALDLSSKEQRSTLPETPTTQSRVTYRNPLTIMKEFYKGSQDSGRLEDDLNVRAMSPSRDLSLHERQSTLHDTPSTQSRTTHRNPMISMKELNKDAQHDGRVEDDLNASVMSPSLDLSLNERRQSILQETPAVQSRVTHRNPLTRMKELSMDNDLFDDRKKTTTSDAADSNLWSDTEEVISNELSGSPTCRNRDTSKQPVDNSKKKRLRRTSVESNMSTSSKNVVDAEVELSLQSYDIEQVGKEMKPDFQNPILGPFEFEPLKLSESDDENNDVFEVPASINRYLPTYQRAGIKFIFNTAIVSGRGAILGDDMGLGKTIQIVSLLAALLKKKGTGMDMVELDKRSVLIQSRSLKLQDDNDKALLQGKVPLRESGIGCDKKELHLPHWCPILILSPNGVVQDWMKSFSTWGHFAASEYKGPIREAVLEDVKNGLTEIMVCTKSMFERKEHFDELLLIHWKIVVIDEFHNYKNERGHLSINLRLMRDALDCAVVGLTGTIMQNDHKELWNLIDLAAKNHVGPWSEFEAKYARPIKLSRTKDASESVVELGRTRGRELREKLKEIYLRRTKAEVLSDELPMKEERIIFCEPSSLQKELYKFIIQLPDFKLLSESNGPCDCGVNQKFFLEIQRLQSKQEQIAYQRKHRKRIVRRCDCCHQIPRNCDVAGGIEPKAVLWRQGNKDNKPCPNCPFCILFPALHILYKLSSHASMLQLKAPPDHFAAGSEARRNAELELERATTFIPEEVLSQLPGQSYVRQDGIMDNHFKLSGKMVVVDMLLRAIKLQQGRVLLFSFSTQMLDLLENYLVAEGYSFLRMDGSTSSKKRTELTTEFKKNNDIFVFLLSTKAMGLGLNLTEANFVIIYDVDWNPSNDAQAQDRAYRIGQERNVKIFRLVSRGTIEEMKYLRQVYKTQLTSETIVSDDDEDRASATRHFRGVAGDVTRKGELFGLANLLKFNDGPFMNYPVKESESRQYGVGVHDTNNLIEKVCNLTEDQIHDIGEDTDVFDHIVKRSSNLEHVESIERNNLDLGGESQINLDICHRAKIDSPSESSSDSLSNHFDDMEELEDKPKTIMDMELASVSKTDKVLNLAHTSPPPKNQRSQKLHTLPVVPADGLASLRATSAEKQTTPKKMLSRNTVLVGTTVDKIRSGDVGKTTFQAKDLYIPHSASRRHKRKKP